MSMKTPKRKKVVKKGWMVVEYFNGHEIYSELYERKMDAEYRAQFWARVHHGIKNEVVKCEMTYTYELP